MINIEIEFDNFHKFCSLPFLVMHRIFPPRNRGSIDRTSFELNKNLGDEFQSFQRV